MQLLSAITLILAGTFMASFADAQKLTVTSPVFAANALMPSKYSCEGEEVSPPLNITGLPSKTKSLALIVHDPDADKPGGMTHWVAWNLPLNGVLTENENLVTHGFNGAGTPGWKGMCPPTGTHHYHFKVYALDIALELPAGTDKTALEKAMDGHVLGEGELIGLYKKVKQ